MSGSGASLFGLALPAFAVVDGFMATYLAPLPRLTVWGCLMATLVMFLYRLISPQQKIAKIRLEAATSRRQMADFDGEFEELMPLVRHSLTLSLRQIGWILFPALLASLPLVSCLIWLDSQYGYRTLAVGETVQLAVSPETERIRSVPATALNYESDGWRVEWPQKGATVALLDRHGATLAVLKTAPSSDVVETYRWWNTVVGNPMGYLPADSPVKRLELGLEPVELLARGPSWIRGWEAPFFFSLILLSILFKVVFRIE